MKTLHGIKKNSIKTKLIVYLLSVALIFSGIGLTLLTNNFGKGSSNDASATKVTMQADGFGQFASGTIYTFTDPSKMSGYRGGSLSSDTTQIKVDTTQTRGSQKNPFVISDSTDWETFVKYCGINPGNSRGKYFALGADIDFAGTTPRPVIYFEGHFYGLGHTIKNVTIGLNDWVYWNGSSYVQVGTNTNYCGTYGLFMIFSGGADVCDLVIDNYKYTRPNIAQGNNTSSGGHTFVGGLVGAVYKNNVSVVTNILNVHTQGTICGTGTSRSIYQQRMGGIFGLMSDATLNVYRCTGNVNSYDTPTSAWVGTGGMGGHTNPNGHLNIFDCVGVVNNNCGSSSDSGSPVMGWDMCHTVIENFVGSDIITTTGNSSFSSAVCPFENYNSYPTGSKRWANVYSRTTRIKSGTTTWQVCGAQLKLTSGFTNINIVSKSPFATRTLGQEITNGVTKYTCTGKELITNNVIPFFSGNTKYSRIWDTSKMAGLELSEFTTSNSPVRNYLKNYVATTMNVEYSGSAYDLADVYSEEIASGLIKSVTKKDSSKNYTDVGTYTFDVVLGDSDDWLFEGQSASVRTATVTVNIVPAKISIMGTIPVTEYGVLKDGVDLISLTDGIFPRDLTTYPDGAPDYVLEYKKTSSSVWTEKVPTVSGDYYVRAKIKNTATCNYVLDGDGQVKFTMPKQNVAVPYFTGAAVAPAQISGTVTTVPYTGDYQVFKLVNSSDGTTLSGVTPGARSGSNGNALMYNQATGEFRAKEVGTYTVSVTLSDGGANTRWANYQNTAEERIITLVITKAELNVTILNSSVTSWQKGEVENIVAKVTGIKNDEKVKIKAECGAVGETPVAVADDAMVQTGDTITITVNLDTFDANKSYNLKISLAPDNEATANANYTLNTANTSFDFFILTAVIDDVNAPWIYDNIIAGYGQTITDKGQVDYNAQPYDVSLDKSQLPKGVKVTYKHEKQNSSGVYEAVDDCISAGYYKTTVTIATEPGYELGGSVSTVQTIDWEIKPIDFDLNQLVMADNPQWTGKQREITIANLPDWIYLTAQGHKRAPVGKYTVQWTLDADENHNFLGTDGEVLTNKATIVSNYGKEVILSYDWEVIPAIISVSNSPKQWVKTDVVSSSGQTFEGVLVPDVYSQYSDVLKLTYFDSSNTEVDFNTLTLDLSQANDFTCRVELDASVTAASNYQVVNSIIPTLDYAVVPFSIGGDKEPIDIEYDLEPTIIYDTQPHGVTATTPGYDVPIVSSYAKLKDGTVDTYEPLADGEVPTAVGKYRVNFSVKDEVDGDGDNYKETYMIGNGSVDYFEIVTLDIRALSWTDGDPVPTATVESDLTDPVPASCYGYKYYPADDFKNYLKDNTLTLTEVKPEDFAYSTRYIAVLVATDDNAKIDETSPYWYEFTSAADPNGPQVMIPDPVAQPNVYEYTGADITATLQDWQDDYWNYVEILSGSLTQTAIGTYTVEFGIKSGANATWAWVEPVQTRTLTFEIIGKILKRPTLSQEIRYTGEDIYATDYLQDFDADWMEISGTEFAKTVGKYTLVVMLKDPVNSRWEDATATPASFVVAEKPQVSLMSATQSLAVSNVDSKFASLVSVTGEKAVVTTAETSIPFEWEIQKAQISGSWTQTEDGYQQFVPTDPAMGNFLDYEYFEADGVTPVAVEDMAEGGSYVAKAKVKPEHSGNVEFLDDAGNPVGEEVEMPFNFEVPKSFFAGLMAGLLNFVNLNWKILVIAAAVLLLGIVLFSVIKHLKNSKEKRADAKAKKAADKKTKEIAKQQEKAKQKQEKEQQKALEKQAQKNGVSVEQQKQINAMNGVNPDGTPAINPMMAGMMGGMAGATMANAMGANGMPNGVAMGANGVAANSVPMANGAVGVNATVPNAMAGGTVAGVNGVGVNGMPMTNGVVMGANGVPVANGVGASGVLNALGGFGANGVTLVSGVPVANNVLAGAISAGAPTVIGTNGMTVALPVAVPAAQQSQPQQPQIIQVPTGNNDNGMTAMMQMMLMQQMLNNSNNNNNNNSNNNGNNDLIAQLLQASEQRAKTAEEVANRTSMQLLEQSNKQLEEQLKFMQQMYSKAEQPAEEEAQVVYEEPQQVVYTQEVAQPQIVAEPIIQQQVVAEPVVQPVQQAEPVVQVVQQPVVQQQSGDRVSVDALCNMITAFVNANDKQQQNSRQRGRKYERDDRYYDDDRYDRYYRDERDGGYYRQETALSREDRQLLQDVRQIAAELKNSSAPQPAKTVAVPQPVVSEQPTATTIMQPMLQPQMVIPHDATITTTTTISPRGSEAEAEQPVAEEPKLSRRERKRRAQAQEVDAQQAEQTDAVENYFYNDLDK